MKTATILTILKWVALVFLAGFIGYFGKYLSKLIIARLGRKKKKEEEPQTPSQAELDYKLEKKRLKQQQKIEKKKSGD